jgi:hemoglobin
MRPRMTFVIGLFSLALAALAACGGKGKGETTPGNATGDTAAASDKTLYERLGGTEAIRAVVKEFMATTAADPRIDLFFTNVDAPRLEQLMVEQICAGTGGPCEYTGKTMRESHTGMGVKPEHFEAFIEDLTLTLDKLGVRDPEKSEVLTIFRSMADDIVNL